MRKKIAKILLLAFIVVACNSSDDNNTSGDGFDRSSLLTFTADNIIIPATADLQTKVDALKMSVEAFTGNPDQTTLNTLSEAWLTAYKTWQHVEMFNIGPAEAINDYYFFMNTYPVSEEDVNDAVITGNYDLTISNFHDAQGFPAIDYLIHSENALDFFTSHPNAEDYKDYINVLVDRMKDLTDEVLNTWITSYRNSFIANTENSLTGSVNKFVSDFVFFYEKGFRANKFGIPAGVFAGFASPEKVEALYKKEVSKALALEALTAIEDVFNGRGYASNTTGSSLKTYLEFLDNAELVASINSQFGSARTTINNLDDNFYQIVADNNNQMLATYDIIQAAVPLLKVDMAQQAFGMTIDFNDSDGD